MAPERQLRVTLSRLAGPSGLGPALVILTSGTAGRAALGLLTSAQLLPDGGRCLAFWVGKSGGFLAFAGIPAPPGLEGGCATHTHTNTHANTQTHMYTHRTHVCPHTSTREYMYTCARSPTSVCAHMYVPCPSALPKGAHPNFLVMGLNVQHLSSQAPLGKALPYGQSREVGALQGGSRALAAPLPSGPQDLGLLAAWASVSEGPVPMAPGPYSWTDPGVCLPWGTSVYSLVQPAGGPPTLVVDDLMPLAQILAGFSCIPAVF